MTPRIGVAACVIRNNHLLLGKRIGSHGSGEWSAPGGHLDFGETPAACAARELLEETGLIATKIISGPWTNDLFPTKHYITIWMFITEFTGTPTLLEPTKCESWEWCPVDNLPEPLFLPLKNVLAQRPLAKTLELFTNQL